MTFRPSKFSVESHSDVTLSPLGKSDAIARLVHGGTDSYNSASWVRPPFVFVGEDEAVVHDGVAAGEGVSHNQAQVSLRFGGRDCIPALFPVFRPRGTLRLRTTSALLKWAGMQSGPPKKVRWHEVPRSVGIHDGQKGAFRILRRS